LAMANTDARVGHRTGNNHEARRSSRARPPEMRQDRSIVWIFQAAAEEPAGLHQLMAGLMNRSGVVVYGAHQSIAIGHLSHERETLSDGNTGNIRANRPERPADRLGCLGLQVPGVELAGTSNEKQQDAIDIATPGATGVKPAQIG